MMGWNSAALRVIIDANIHCGQQVRLKRQRQNRGICQCQAVSQGLDNDWNIYGLTNGGSYAYVR